MSGQPKPAPPLMPRTPITVIVAGAGVMPPCPECWVGSHRSCTNTTWDGESDDFAPCPCAKAGHSRQLIARQVPT